MATEDELREKITFGLRDAYEAKMECQRLISEVGRAKYAPCEACGHKLGSPPAASWWAELKAGYRRVMG